MAKYKYSGRKTKAHPKGDFRKQSPKLIRTTAGPYEGGGYMWVQRCDEYHNGRWEGFNSQRSKVYSTKAEALKHKPKW